MMNFNLDEMITAKDIDENGNIIGKNFENDSSEEEDPKKPQTNENGDKMDLEWLNVNERYILLITQLAKRVPFP